MLSRVLPLSALVSLSLIAPLALPSHAAPKLPTSGKIVSLTNGDLMCYVKLKDSKGKIYDLGATFELCNEQKFLNKKVQVAYQKSKVNDCQSAEPCGKTRWEMLIVKMKLIK